MHTSAQHGAQIESSVLEHFLNEPNEPKRSFRLIPGVLCLLVLQQDGTAICVVDGILIHFYTSTFGNIQGLITLQLMLGLLQIQAGAAAVVYVPGLTT